MGWESMPSRTITPPPPNTKQNKTACLSCFFISQDPAKGKEEGKKVCVLSSLQGKGKEGRRKPWVMGESWNGSQSWKLDSPTSVAFHYEDSCLLSLMLAPHLPPQYIHSLLPACGCGGWGRKASPVIPASLSGRLPEYSTYPAYGTCSSPSPPPTPTHMPVIGCYLLSEESW